jgi:DNA-binding MarR family transcriptional regulator
VSDNFAAIERAMNRIRRSQTRRSLARRAAAAGVDLPADLSVLGVVDAVDEGPSAGADVVSVADVADRLGVDPSRASRLVKAAIEADLVRRVASQSDGRRTGLALTQTGTVAVAAAHRSRQQLYAELTAGWSSRDRADLARLLTRFTEKLD